MAISKEKIDGVLALLCNQFPKAFFMYEGRRRPLKIGIHRDLDAALDASVDRKILHAALRFYTRNVGYRRAQKAGAARIDLAGEAVGTVSEEDALSAQRAVAGIKAAAIEKQKRRKHAKEEKPQPVPQAAPQPVPKRDGLSALREAARKRNAVGEGVRL
jgi:ProP effector